MYVYFPSAGLIACVAAVCRVCISWGGSDAGGRNRDLFSIFAVRIPGLADTGPCGLVERYLAAAISAL